LDEQLHISDVVILTLPLTDQTKNMFDCVRFSKMKIGAIFVNIARGGLVNEGALVKALDKDLYGAVLDVFDTEPLPEESPLWDKKNVIICVKPQ
jgi:phosphoglycerate dehydrogenase-like enzyme